ncbi:MAG TPA: hypothetical protein VD816_11930 [Ohtaekwangia sp.]|nr:hypothetical protein [Ohtaekwangia sp.]
MKTKFLLPLFAAVVATLFAFSPPLAQKGWYDSNGPMAGGGVEADIDVPALPICSTSATQHECQIIVDGDPQAAYNSRTAAETKDPSGLLKFND